MLEVVRVKENDPERVVVRVGKLKDIDVELVGNDKVVEGKVAVNVREAVTVIAVVGPVVVVENSPVALQTVSTHR